MINNINTAITNGQMVAAFSFHISRLELSSVEHQAMNYLLSMCMARDLDFKVLHSWISSVDMAIRVYVFNAPADMYDIFYLYHLRPVY